MTSICATCAHLSIPEGSRNRWRGWLCIARPLPQWTNPVTGSHGADPPHLECFKANPTGDCPLHTTGPNILHPREKTDE